MYIVYDKVKNHTYQDFNGSDTSPIHDTFECLLWYLGGFKDEDGKPIFINDKRRRCEFEVAPMDVKLDSTMFTDEGNKLMKKCYKRWIDSVSIISWEGRNGNKDISFEPFTREIAKLHKVPEYINPEPNIKDAYDFKPKKKSEIKKFVESLCLFFEEEAAAAGDASMGMSDSSSNADSSSSTPVPPTSPATEKATSSSTSSDNTTAGENVQAKDDDVKLFDTRPEKMEDSKEAKQIFDGKELKF